MKTIFKSSVIFLLMLFFICDIALSATATSNPNPYKIIMKKAELRNSVTLEYVTVGEGDLTIDIASVNAGELAAGYVTGSAIPEGTYDRIKVTLSRDMTIKASYTDATGALAGVAGKTYYTTAAAGAGGSIATSATAGDNTEGTCQVPADGGVKVDEAAGTYTDTYNLPSVITIAKGSTQKVRVRFDVTGAATFQNIGPGTAVAYPTAPAVDITIVN